MDENKIESKQTKSEKRLTRGTAALFVILLCAAVAVLRVTGILKPSAPPEPPAAGNTAPPPSPSPNPAGLITEPPTAAASPGIMPTDEPEKYIKTSVKVDGEIKATLASRQAAEEMIQNTIRYFEAACMTDGLISDIKNDVQLVSAGDSAATISYDEAYALFTGPDSPVTVESRASFTETESIAHEREEIQSELLYAGTRLVSSYGRDGKNLRVHEYIYINGVLKETSELETRMLYAPVDEVIIIGTAEIPMGEAPDSEFGKADCPRTELKFNFPVHAEITKLFGFYSGVMYNGIDFAAGEGTLCGASCAGRVLSVMERGSRGTVVDLLHEGGFITRYAGLRSAGVNVGDTVGSGEPLGVIGKEGLHFEILYESRPRNPRIYLLGLFE